jgi:hypothetical protein
MVSYELRDYVEAERRLRAAPDDPRGPLDPDQRAQGGNVAEDGVR